MRRDQVTQWLRSNHWADWTRSAITGDASARSYERLRHQDGRTAILMNAPPEVSGSQSAFITLAQHLIQSGVAAPEIYAWDDSLGLMVLEDLGTVDFAQYLVLHPEDEKSLYSAALEVLSHIQEVPAPVGLQTLAPDIAVEMVSLAFDWAAPNAETALRQATESELQRLLESIDHKEKVLSLRDF
ncbi:MAG: phosphotransferase, partial [Octadecabacter sp.]|nr:phosphotransferase [Octadecabacter sp.]